MKNLPCQNDVFLAEENDMSDGHGDDAGNGAKRDRVSRYLSRRVKEYSSWEDVRQSLLQDLKRKLSPLTRCASNVAIL